MMIAVPDMQDAAERPRATTFHLLLGIAMAIAGGCLLVHRVEIGGGIWNRLAQGGAGRTAGILLLPILLGIAFLLVTARSFADRFRVATGVLVLAIAVIASLDVHVQPTPWWNTLAMLVLLVGGVSLIVVPNVLPCVSGEAGREH